MSYDPRSRSFDGTPEAEMHLPASACGTTVNETIAWTVDGTLPDADFTVLVCTRDGDVDAAFYTGDRWYWVGTEQRIKDLEIKAWAHLPKGPL